MYILPCPGPTSAGKTSLVMYLARRTGHRCIRINNHEHTDLQEYMGSYVSDPKTGKLVFQDGALVEAVKNGYWVVLDELNLAPSEVLEALNRLLDDNRELFIPETQETVKPHPDFLLFATQNPPSVYGGRKVLSRAFQNRFVTLHCGDIPEKELETILVRQCGLPPKYCEYMVAVMIELQKIRQTTGLFAGKKSFLTPRDLFRWGHRVGASNHLGQPLSYQQLAEQGYMLLGERLRDEASKQVVKTTIEKHCLRSKKKKIDVDTLYDQEAVLKSLQSMLTHFMAGFEGAGSDAKQPELSIEVGMSAYIYIYMCVCGNDEA
jgi:midasin